jgi:hypothetical protein
MRSEIPTETESTTGAFPAWLSRLIWLVIGLAVLGLTALPAFNVHTSVGPSLVVILGLGGGLWMCPILLITSLTYILRARQFGVRPARAEAVQTALLGAGSLILVVLTVLER